MIIIRQVLLERQALGDMYLMREVANDTRGHWRAEEAKCDKGHLGPPWASVWNGPDHIYFGHDHQRGLQVHLPGSCTPCIGCTICKRLNRVGWKREGLDWSGVA